MYSGSEDGTIRLWDLRAPGCQREYTSRAAVNTVVLHPNQGELISGAPPAPGRPHQSASGCCRPMAWHPAPAGDQQGNIRVWDLTANACSCELVPEVGTAVRSLTVALDASLVVAANNAGAAPAFREHSDAAWHYIGRERLRARVTHGASHTQTLLGMPNLPKARLPIEAPSDPQAAANAN